LFLVYAIERVGSFKVRETYLIAILRNSGWLEKITQ
jgi:hypothetical protein